MRTLRRLPELGVDFIKSADSYGPDVVEPLRREALHPYNNMVIATKGDLRRSGPDRWIPLGRPQYLIQQAPFQTADAPQTKGRFGKRLFPRRVFPSGGFSRIVGTGAVPAR